MAPPRQGTGFINWDRFVNANRGTIDRMAGDLAAPVEEEGQRLSNVLDTSNRAFDTGVAKANEPLQNLRPLEVTGVGLDWEGAYKRKEDEYRKAGTTPYGGPRSLADVEGFSEGLQAADRNAGASQNIADIYGRSAALGKRYGGTTEQPYTGAARLFDSALLQSSPGQQRFEANRAQYGQQGTQYRQALGESKTAGDFAAQQYGDVAKSLVSRADEWKARRERLQEEERKRNAETEEYWKLIGAKPPSGKSKWEPITYVPPTWGRTI